MGAESLIICNQIEGGSIVIPGSVFGGVDGVNNCVITINSFTDFNNIFPAVFPLGGGTTHSLAGGTLWGYIIAEEGDTTAEDWIASGASTIPVPNQPVGKVGWKFYAPETNLGTGLLKGNTTIAAYLLADVDEITGNISAYIGDAWIKGVGFTMSGVGVVDKYPGEAMLQTPITKTWKYTLKAGSYSPSDLADIMTKNMAEIQTNKTTTSINPPQLFGGSKATNLNNFLIKGTAISVDLNVNTTPDAPITMPDDFINANRYDDGLVQSGRMLFSSNSAEFASQPQHAGVFSNFLIDTPFNTDYFDPSYQLFYGFYNLLNSPFKNPLPVNPTNLTTQFTNPIMFMPSHYSMGYGNAWSAVNSGSFDVGVGNWYREYASSIVGASEISLEYNPDSEVFQFTYMHTPLMEQPLTAGASSTDASEPVEVVKIIKTNNVNINAGYQGDRNYAVGEVKVCEQTRHSGIIFQSMEPQSFWQNIMGFDVPNITVSAEEIWGVNRTLTFEKFTKITTSGYVGIENNFNTTMTAKGTATTGNTVPVVPNKNAPAYLAPFPTPTLANKTPTSFVYTYTQLMNSDEWILENYILQNDVMQPLNTPEGDFVPCYDYGALAGEYGDYYEEYSSALNTTNPLQAIQIPLSQANGSGHYLVEIVGYNNNVNDFINDNSIYAIKSIVASYYVSPNSFVTQPFADPATYEHIGDSVYINKFRIRLLDPITMKVATPLGPNSSVYLQLGKQLSKLALTQPM